MLTSRETPRLRAGLACTLIGAAMGLALFLVQNIGVWAAMTAPAGSVPVYYLRNADSSQYLGFIALASNHLLFPDLHIAWRTEPAMFNPIFLIGGRVGSWIGLSPVATLEILQILFYIGAGIALAWVLETLLATRAQRIGAVVVALLCLPPTMFLLGAPRFFFPALTPWFYAGAIQLSYSTADGLLRGGLSNSPTLSFGSSMVLATLCLSVLRLTTGRRIFSWLIAGFVFLSAIVHPFEVFVIVPSFVVGLLWLERKAWRELIPAVAAAVLGLLPHLYLTWAHSWLGDLSQSFDTELGVSKLILDFGFGFLAVFFLLMARGRLPEDKVDRFVLLWWVLTVGISLIPGAPFPPHLRDGLTVVTGILVVRLAASDPKLNAVFQANRRTCFAALGVVLLMAGVAYGQVYMQIARDGRSLDAEFLLNAAASNDEVAVLDDFRKLGHVDDLVLAPPALSMLLVRAPMHSFASHQHLSLDYFRETDQATNFFDHKMSQTGALDFLASYGIHWVVLEKTGRAAKYFAGTSPTFQHGGLQVFELPGNAMKEYPGLAAINPNREQSPSIARQVLHILRR